MSRISRDLAAHHSQGKSSLRALSSQRPTGLKLPHVAVIGAGFAGLRCADVLLRNGSSVTIFEARNRIGGRVFQCATEGQTFDMGPNWIHGTDGNPMMTIAESTGTVLLKPEERQMIFDSMGHPKSEEESVRLGADTWATVVDAFKYSNESCTDIDPQTSLMDFFRQRISKAFPHDQTQAKERLNEARMWGPFVGDPIDRQSLRNFFLEECLEGENLMVASSYSKMLSEVARRAQQAAKFRLNEEVMRIEYREIGDSPNQVTLTTTQGEQASFDEVVVTCPLGWLKHHKEDAFSPSLPPRLSEAIDNIGYGNLEKIYVTFPSAWWVGRTGVERTNGTLDSMTARADQSRQDTPIFLHFHHPTYHPDPASKQNEYWNQSVVSMAHFPGSTARPTLLFYMYGPCSLHMTSMIRSSEPGSESYNSLLSAFLQPFIERIPNYSATSSECKPVSFVATQWSNDPLAGHGSYSNFQVGLMRGDEDIECMRNAGGLSDAGHGLWLAGEHTAPFVAIGTTTGAYWSGEGVARRILNMYGIPNVKTGSEAPGIETGDKQPARLDGEIKDGANLAALAI